MKLLLFLLIIQNLNVPVLSETSLVSQPFTVANLTLCHFWLSTALNFTLFLLLCTPTWLLLCSPTCLLSCARTWLLLHAHTVPRYGDISAQSVYTLLTECHSEAYCIDL